MNNQQESFSDATEMERNSILGRDTTDEDCEIAKLKGEIEDLESDCMTLALRLYGENPDSFAPETREVMDRWSAKVTRLLSGEQK